MPEIEFSLLLYGLVVGLGAGLIGGLLAGLAGVGGGLIYVPLFYAFMPDTGDGIAIHIFASMVAIVITGFFSARAHWRLQHVDKHKLAQLLPGLIIASAFGLWMTLQLPQLWLLLALAGLNGFIAYDYGRPESAYRGRRLSLPLFSGPIGLLSGLLGIGGGTMLVPLLRRHIDLRHAVGTSATCGAIMAAAAVILNLSMENSWTAMLTDHVWFLAGLWSGLLIIIPLSTAWAAGLHTSVSDEILRSMLKSLFICLSLALLAAAWMAD